MQTRMSVPSEDSDPEEKKSECEETSMLIPVCELAKDSSKEPAADQLFMLRCLYFLSGISSSTWGRFSTIYYSSLGFSAFQIGTIEGTMPLVVAVVQPLWGVMADRWFGKKAVYTFCRVFSTVLLISLALPFVSAHYETTLAVSLAMSLFSSGGVLDAYALQICGEHSRKLYGRLRMWTAVFLPTRPTAHPLASLP